MVNEAYSLQVASRTMSEALISRESGAHFCCPRWLADNFALQQRGS